LSKPTEQANQGLLGI